MGEPVILCRCWANGTTSMVLTLDKPLREYLDLKPQDVLAFRLVVIGGKRMVLGEKVPLTRLARLAAATPAEPLTVEGEKK